MATAYDRLPYPNHVHRVTHPGRFGALATLCGREAPPLETSRILEVGCSGGANLLSIAAGLPGATCVGFDLASTAIDEARDLASLSGLKNVSFQVADIADVSFDTPFDYVIAHGVYSWIPADVRASLMRLLGRVLSPNGLALVSYNVFPGCRSRHALRDILRHATCGLTDPEQVLAVAEKVLQGVAATLDAEDPFPAAILEEAQDKLRRPISVLFHDELGEVWEPQIFGDVVDAARREGLVYVCDMNQRTLADAFEETSEFAAARAFTGGDWEAYEQWCDYTDMRRFRLSVLARDNGSPITRVAEPSRLRTLYATGQIERIKRDADETTFRTGEKVELDADRPKARALFDSLAAAQPNAIPLMSIAEDAAASALLYQLILQNGVFLSTAPSSFTLVPGEHPLASPVARAFASRGLSRLPGLSHRVVKIEDDVGRYLLQLLDGTRTRAEIVQALAAFSGTDARDVAARLEPGLQALARMTLLQA